VTRGNWLTLSILWKLRLHWTAFKRQYPLAKPLRNNRSLVTHRPNTCGFSAVFLQTVPFMVPYPLITARSPVFPALFNGVRVPYIAISRAERGLETGFDSPAYESFPQLSGRRGVHLGSPAPASPSLAPIPADLSEFEIPALESADLSEFEIPNFQIS
jgi:hypothetical protein